jgi:hypothetical protein
VTENIILLCIFKAVGMLGSIISGALAGILWTTIPEERTSKEKWQTAGFGFLCTVIFGLCTWLIWSAVSTDERLKKEKQDRENNELISQGYVNGYRAGYQKGLEHNKE